MFALVPAPHAHYPRATRTYVFCKSRFRARRPPVTVDQDGDFHRDAFFGPVKQKFVPGRHIFCSSSQARGNAREILNAASAAVLHDIESAVSRTKKFFGCVAILGKSSDSRADG